MKLYTIECRHASGSSHWDREPDSGTYTTPAEAEAEAAKLEAADEDGAPLEYRIVPCGGARRMRLDRMGA